jgi:type I restriction-modification system DNA methylase subunit
MGEAVGSSPILSILFVPLINKFSEVDLSPDKVDNHTMGTIFEELIRRFNEQMNENPGEHFTPREVIKLMVRLVLRGDETALKQPGVIRTIYDCACGSGGMLSIAKDYIREKINSSADIRLCGESEIRRWILENDWLETIVALPGQLFYNTGITTYIWVLSNRKPEYRKGKVLLVNGAATYKVKERRKEKEIEFFAQKMRKSLGDKRNELGEEHIDKLDDLAFEFDAGDFAKIFDHTDFGYRKITIERPLRLNFTTSPERIANLKASSAINFNRHFYQYQALRPRVEIAAEIEVLKSRLFAIFNEKAGN